MQAGDVMVDHCRMDVLYVCSCVCFARVLSFPDFVDLENIMVFILLCDTRCIFRFMWCPFSRVSWLFSSTVSFYLYTFERASGDSCSREQLSWWLHGSCVIYIQCLMSQPLCWWLLFPWFRVSICLAALLTSLRFVWLCIQARYWGIQIVASCRSCLPGSLLYLPSSFWRNWSNELWPRTVRHIFGRTWMCF